MLEAKGYPLGVVAAINGATRMLVTVKGLAGHAGCVPMELRRDAVAAAAEMILAVEARAQAPSPTSSPPSDGSKSSRARST